MGDQVIRESGDLSLTDMGALAGRLAGVIRSGDMITLRGEVGAGKTTFARALLAPLLREKVEVTSPTFNLMQSYDVTLADGKKETVWHIDLYRLEEADEADALGLRELEQHIILMEWPEIIERKLPATRLDITLTFGTDMESRKLLVQGNDAWRERLATVW